MNKLLLETLGEEKIKELYNFSKNDYEIVNYFFSVQFLSNGNQLISYNMIQYKNKSFIDKIKNSKIEELKDICYEYAIKYILEKHHEIKIDEYPKEFIKDNKEILLQYNTIPTEIKEKYYKKELTIDDAIKYIDYFKTNIEDFLDYNYDLSLLAEKTGSDKLKIILKKYPTFIKYIVSHNELYNFDMFLKIDENFEESFIKSTKKYLINNLEETIDTRNDKTIYEIPNWFKEFNFILQEKFNNLEDILNYQNNIVILDEQQQLICQIIEMFNIENIRKLEQEIKYFSHDNNEFMTIYNIVFFYNNNKKLFKNQRNNGILDFKNGKLTYTEFRCEFAKLLNIMRINQNVSNYDWITGQFRIDNKEFFIDEKYPKILKDLFYQNNITAKFLSENLEYLELIKNDNIEQIINSNTKIRVREKLEKDYKIETKNFMNEYIKIYGKQKYIELIIKYGKFLDYIEIQGTNNELYNEKELEKNIRKEVYKKIIHSNINHMYLENNIEFVKEYEELFINLDDLNIEEKEKIRIKNDFYNQNLQFNDIKKYKELIEILKNKNLLLAFFKSRTTDFSNNDIEFEYQGLELLKIISQEDFLNLCSIYGRYMKEINNDVYQFLLKRTNFIEIKIENIKKIIEKKILLGCLKGNIHYCKEDAPEFLLKHEELFLNDDAPEELKDLFYFKNREQLTFEKLSKHKEWIKYLKNKRIVQAFFKNNKRENNGIIEFFDKFGEHALTVCASKPDTVLKMINTSRVSVMKKWFEKTNYKFIPDYSIMNNIGLTDIDKFLQSIKIWTRFANLEEYNKNDENKDALVKIAYAFGVFHQDKYGINKLYQLLTEIPKKIPKEREHIIEGINFFGEQYINNEITSLPFDGDLYLELKENLKKEKFKLKEKDIFKQLYRKNSDGTYTLTINQQSYPKSCQTIRKIFEQYDDMIKISEKNIHKLFSGFEVKYNKKFIEFFLKNIDKILEDEDHIKYLPRIQKTFEEIEIINSNRKITLHLCLSYVKTREYKDIELGNDELAHICLMTGYNQDEFNLLQQIYNYGRIRTFSSIPRFQSKNEKYTYQILELDNPKTISEGTNTNCCQEIGNYAETSMEHSMTSKDGGIFEIRDNMGRLVAQSWVWRNKDTLCFDNIEVSDRQMWEHGIPKGREDDGIRNEFTDEILDIYKEVAKKLIEIDEKTLQKLLEEKKITEEQYKIFKLKKITVGIGFSNVKGSIKILEKDDLNIAPIDYVPPVKLKNPLYINDSKKQYILVKTNEPITAKKIKSIYPYHDEFIEYTNETFTELNLLKLEKMAIISNPNYNLELFDYNESDNLVSQIAHNFHLDEKNARIILTPNFSIIYEVNENNIKIGDIIYLKNIKELNIEREVLIQIELALKQIGESKQIDLSGVNSSTFDTYLKIINSENERNIEQGYCICNIK